MFETVKLKIIKKDILAKWKCPKCKKIHSEWLYDKHQKKALHCTDCFNYFNGKLE